MTDRRTANPPLGSTDWAAKQFLRILERDERERAERRTAHQLAQALPSDDTATVDDGLPYGALPQPGDRYNVPAADREAFRNQLENRGGLSPTTRSILDYEFEFEGGNDVNPVNGATAGITRTMLDRFLRQLYDANPEIARREGRRIYEPSELIARPQMQIAFMKWLADSQMGQLHPDDIATPQQPGVVGDPKLALQLYDTLYHYGMSEGSQAIQSGLNEVLAHYRDRLVAGGMSPEQALQAAPSIQIPSNPSRRNVGRQTIGAIRTLLDAGYGDDVRDAINRSVDATWPASPNDNEEYRRSVYR